MEHSSGKVSVYIWGFEDKKDNPNYPEKLQEFREELRSRLEKVLNEMEGGELGILLRPQSYITPGFPRFKRYTDHGKFDVTYQAKNSETATLLAKEIIQVVTNCIIDTIGEQRFKIIHIPGYSNA